MPYGPPGLAARKGLHVFYNHHHCISIFKQSKDEAAYCTVHCQYRLLAAVKCKIANPFDSKHERYSMKKIIMPGPSINRRLKYPTDMYIYEVCRELHVIYFGFNFDTTGKSTAWRTAINNFAKKICSYGLTFSIKKRRRQTSACTASNSEPREIRDHQLHTAQHH